MYIHSPLAASYPNKQLTNIFKTDEICKTLKLIGTMVKIKNFITHKLINSKYMHISLVSARKALTHINATLRGKVKTF